MLVKVINAVFFYHRIGPQCSFQLCNRMGAQGDKSGALAKHRASISCSSSTTVGMQSYAVTNHFLATAAHMTEKSMMKPAHSSTRGL
jgi:hypothetical protein